MTVIIHEAQTGCNETGLVAVNIEARSQLKRYQQEFASERIRALGYDTEDTSRG